MLRTRNSTIRVDIREGGFLDVLGPDGLDFVWYAQFLKSKDHLDPWRTLLEQADHSRVCAPDVLTFQGFGPGVAQYLVSIQEHDFRLSLG